jgi:uncharacterized protein (TIRG00374 family)
LTSDKSTFTKIKSIIGYSLPFILTIAFLYLAIYNVEFDESINSLKNISLLWFIPYLITFFLSHWIRAIRWKVILHSVKKETSSLYLFSATMIGYGVNFAVPRLGELYRAFFAGRWEGLSRSSVLGTIVIERVIDVIILGLSVLVSVQIFAGDLYEEIVWLKSALIIGFIGICSVVILLVLLIKLQERFVNVVISFVSKISKRLSEKVAYILRMLIDGFASLQGFKNYFLTIVHSILIMLLYALSAYLAFFVLHMDEIQPIDFGTAWVVMTISAFGIVIPTPGGTGAYHLIAKSVLVILFGFSEEIGLAYAFLTHTSASIIFIALTFIMMFVVNIKRAKLGLPKENFFSVVKLRNQEK